MCSAPSSKDFALCFGGQSLRPLENLMELINRAERQSNCPIFWTVDLYNCIVASKPRRGINRLADPDPIVFGAVKIYLCCINFIIYIFH